MDQTLVVIVKMAAVVAGCFLLALTVVVLPREVAWWQRQPPEAHEMGYWRWLWKKVKNDG